MSFLDSLKAKLSPAKDRVSDLAQQHGGKIGDGLDKAAKTVDQKTKGKYSDKIESGTGKAKDALERMSHKDGKEGGGANPPSSPPPPPPAS
ncbi:antitoxin [Streptomyces sp. NBC_01506]|uniref:antitoxin n=1 Tax=Streptomyces sp. NBC_01506 TaxID=2903887 RepID=UPI00386FD1D6